MITAWLEGGAAVLRFPYDERLKSSLRAIPGRRWDPGGRVWRVALSPTNANSLERWLATSGSELECSAELERALELRCAERDPTDECLVELVRFDERQWLSVCDDVPPELLGDLFTHPQALRLATVARLMLPLDPRSAGLLADLRGRDPRVWVTVEAARALAEVGAGASAPASVPVTPARRVITVACGVAAPGEAVLVLGAAPPAPLAPTLPLTLESWRLLEQHVHAIPSRATARCLAALRRGEAAPAAVLECAGADASGLLVLAPGYDATLLERFAALPAALPWRPSLRAHDEHSPLPAVRADAAAVPALDAFLDAHAVAIDAQALALLATIRDEHARAAGIVALSAATDAPLPGAATARLGGELMPFQRAGVSYLLARRRTFLADEQGLGKTIEALAAIECDGAYPAIVVCPASLKLNWLREIERWLPERTATLVSGRGGDGEAVEAADLTVVNYDVVADRVDQLRAIAPRALVLDESHYVKNARAKRTKAVTRLAAAIPVEGLVFALSGTPVMSRAEELISQLRIIGRLGDFGSGRAFGARFRGPDAHLRLHWHLRARCFARRLKADVLPQLPQKTRSIVPIELDNGEEYRLAEEDVIAWLRSQPFDLSELDARVASALRAERLVRLSALGLIAARGKLAGSLAWIHDFLASGERLVVFARHREIQHAVIERFPRALHLLGSDSALERDRTVAAFQADDSPWNQLLICSLTVAGQGLTLTRASNVAFLELDWTPATHDQAEDRCHRIGQAAAVNASYLLAAATIDETIATLLERKRAVVAAVTDGAQDDEEAIIDALARELRTVPYRHLRAVA